MSQIKMFTTTKMASDQTEEDTVSMSLHEMFHIVGDQMTERDVKLLKFLCGCLIWEEMTAKVQDGFSFLLCMEKVNLVSESNFLNVLDLLRIINRHDLSQFVQLRHRKTVTVDPICEYLESNFGRTQSSSNLHGSGATGKTGDISDGGTRASVPSNSPGPASVAREWLYGNSPGPASVARDCWYGNHGNSPGPASVARESGCGNHGQHCTSSATSDLSSAVSPSSSAISSPSSLTASSLSFHSSLVPHGVSGDTSSPPRKRRRKENQDDQEVKVLSDINSDCRTTREREAPPSASQERLVPPSDSQEIVVPPSDSQERVVPPSDSQERVVPPSDSQERVAPPSDSQERVVPPGAIQERVAPPSDSEERLAPPSHSSSDLQENSRPRGSCPDDHHSSGTNTGTGADGRKKDRVTCDIRLRVRAEVALQESSLQGNVFSHKQTVHERQCEKFMQANTILKSHDLGSIVCDIKFSELTYLDAFWRDYINGSLLEALKGVFLTDSLRQAVGHEAINLLVTVDEDDYDTGRLKLLQNITG